MSAATPPRVLVIGATSAIAEACARLYAARGASLVLVGRDAARLDAIAADLRLRGARAATTHALDANATAGHAAMLDAAWAALGEVDVALIAHGVLPDPAACAASTDAALDAFATNATSVIALGGALLRRLRAPATLAVVASVAGVRGRAANPVYGAAKAAVVAWASGERQARHGSGVNVLTVMPGPLASPMTAHLRPGPLWSTPARVAAGVVRAIDRRRAVAWLPWFWRPLMLAIALLPEAVFRRLRL